MYCNKYHSDSDGLFTVKQTMGDKKKKKKKKKKKSLKKKKKKKKKSLTPKFWGQL